MKRTAFICLSIVAFMAESCASIAVRGLQSRSMKVGRDDTTSGTFASASWIWAPNASGGTVAFMNSFDPPSGKNADSATISITAVGNFTLWVNGHPVGQSSRTGTDGWKTAQVLHAALNATTANLFSVLVRSSDSTTPPPGLLAAIDILYSDNTTSTVVSDSSWLASTDIPPDFPSPSSSHLSAFIPVTVEGPYGSDPWGESVALAPHDADFPTLQGSSWIWSTSNAFLTAPSGSVGFRKTFLTPSGKSAQSARVIATADNSFDFYLGHSFISSPPTDPNLNIPGAMSIWHYPQRFTIDDLNSTLNVFNIIGWNFDAQGRTLATSAGVIAVLQVYYTDGTSDVIRTDDSWSFGPSNAGSTFLLTPDSSLSPVVVQGPLGMVPWNQMLNTTDTLAAASVPAFPFTAQPSTPNNNNLHKTVPVAAIVAPIVGVIAVVALLGVIFMVRKSSRFSSKKRSSVAEILPYSSWHSPTTNSLAGTGTVGPFAASTEASVQEPPPPDYSLDVPLVSVVSDSQRKQRLRPVRSPAST
ncbi:hypothetical protein R3P38DRAFT_178107 [Favolaschia claudopus]|uniref:Uncharacterized protein n=1 Tax=Favolaschia claudopus TaxID=2862362 RepID=A0AAW0D043_9AGAR